MVLLLPVIVPLSVQRLRVLPLLMVMSLMGPMRGAQGQGSVSSIRWSARDGEGGTAR